MTYDRARYLAHRDEIRITEQARRIDLRVWMQSLKMGPCSVCGHTYDPVAMQFDHTGDDKTAAISRLVSHRAGKSRILAEIAKCELVCANCHAVRTARRSSQLAKQIV